MGDRELLGLAARAAGYEPQGMEDGLMYLFGVQRGWNPLTDDGDALRLAVNLKLCIQWDGCEVQVKPESYDSGNPVCAAEVEHDTLSREAATRRAIVRAAAEIGKAMAPSTDGGGK